MTKCPKCGEELDEDIGCMNISCKGWFCFYCDVWHPYGYSCGEAECSWYSVSDQQGYDNWCKNHKEDIFRMLKDSGYYNHWHDVDKYYPKDDPEVEE